MTYSIGDIVDYSTLHWQSDWDYEDVYGEPSDDEISVVGLYSDPNHDCDYYINAETGEVLEVLIVDEEGEEE